MTPLGRTVDCSWEDINDYISNGDMEMFLLNYRAVTVRSNDVPRIQAWATKSGLPVKFTHKPHPFSPTLSRDDAWIAEEDKVLYVMEQVRHDGRDNRP